MTGWTSVRPGLMGRFVCLGSMMLCAAWAHAQQARHTDAQIAEDVQKSLSKPRFADVHAAVKRGLVTLTGAVDLDATKEEAEHRGRHVQGVVAVQDLIQVQAGTQTDVQLRDELAEKLAYVRVGFGTTAFNSFTVAVQNGAVTLGGLAYGQEDKDAAISLAEHFPGVRDVQDDIEVAPVSMEDDRVRAAAARAIYGFPPLQRYALDPAKPIRITVAAGRITLTGVVDSVADRDAAGLRASGVASAFQVTNLLAVATHAAGR